MKTLAVIIGTIILATLPNCCLATVGQYRFQEKPLEVKFESEPIWISNFIQQPKDDKQLQTLQRMSMEIEQTLNEMER
jgi:hypothetical protein